MASTIKPSVFIGSSSENLRLATTLQEALDHETEPQVWHQDGFPPSQYPLEALEKHLDTADFAIFLFAPDDVTLTRGEKRNTVRDNVLFELGLFIGRITRARTFIVKPRGVDLDLPSDLMGITPIEYAPGRSDDNLLASVGPAARKILDVVRSLKTRIKASEGSQVEADADGATSQTDGSSGPSIFQFHEHSTFSDFDFAYFVATAREDATQQREVDEAFRRSSLSSSAEELEVWEARTNLTRMLDGGLSSLQAIRTGVLKYPTNPHLHRILGDALKHHGDTDGAFSQYSIALDCANDVMDAARSMERIATLPKPRLDRENARAKLLALPQGDPRSDTSLCLAMRTLAMSTGMSQIAQSIDELRVKQTPEDVTLKFSLAHSFDKDDADLSMLHYESIPKEERTSMAWNNLGVSYSNLHMPGLAIAAYEIASQRGETIADGNLANLLVHAGFYEMARTRAKKAIVVPDHHSNVVAALSNIDQGQAEEGDKRAAAINNAQKKQDFLRLLGNAALQPGNADVVGTWQTPEGTLEISVTPDGSYLATGEIVRQREVNSLHQLFIGTPVSTTERTVVTVALSRFGDAFEGTFSRKPHGPSRGSLLGSYAREDPVALFPSDADTLRVCVIGFAREEMEWKRPIAIYPPKNDKPDGA